MIGQCFRYALVDRSMPIHSRYSDMPTQRKSNYHQRHGNTQYACWFSNTTATDGLPCKRIGPSYSAAAVVDSITLIGSRRSGLHSMLVFAEWRMRDMNINMVHRATQISTGAMIRHTRDIVCTLQAQLKCCASNTYDARHLQSARIIDSVPVNECIHVRVWLINTKHWFAHSEFRMKIY